MYMYTQVVSDESRRTLEICQHACKSGEDPRRASTSVTASSPLIRAGNLVQSQLCAAWTHLNDISAHMQV